jgi:hypothetical protein
MAVVESHGIEVHEGPTEAPSILLRTEIRGDTVSARWEHGSLRGDDELVRRVTNLAVWRQMDLGDLAPAQLISLAREACAAPIEAEVLLRDRLSDPAGDPTAQAGRPPRRT